MHLRPCIQLEFIFKIWGNFCTVHEATQRLNCCFYLEAVIWTLLSATYQNTRSWFGFFYFFAYIPYSVLQLHTFPRRMTYSFPWFFLLTTQSLSSSVPFFSKSCFFQMELHMSSESKLNEWQLNTLTSLVWYTCIFCWWRHFSITCSEIQPPNAVWHFPEWRILHILHQCLLSFSFCETETLGGNFRF